MVEYKSRARASRVSLIFFCLLYVNGLYYFVGLFVILMLLFMFFGNGFGIIVSVIEELSVFFLCILCTILESSTLCAVLYKVSVFLCVSFMSVFNCFVFSL